MRRGADGAFASGDADVDRERYFESREACDSPLHDEDARCVAPLPRARDGQPLSLSPRSAHPSLSLSLSLSSSAAAGSAAAVSHRDRATARAGLSDYKLLCTTSARGGDLVKESVALYAMAVLHDNVADYTSSLSCYHRMEALAERTRDQETFALAANCIGVTLHRLGKYDEAIAAHLRHRKVATSTAAHIYALCNEGLAQRVLGNFQRAVLCHRHALDAALESNDVAGECLASGHLGIDYTAWLARDGDGCDRELAYEAGAQFLERYMELSETRPVRARGERGERRDEARCAGGPPSSRASGAETPSMRVLKAALWLRSPSLSLARALALALTRTLYRLCTSLCAAALRRAPLRSRRRTASPPSRSRGSSSVAFS